MTRTPPHLLHLWDDEGVQRREGSQALATVQGAVCRGQQLGAQRRQGCEGGERGERGDRGRGVGQAPQGGLSHVGKPRKKWRRRGEKKKRFLPSKM